MRAERPSKVKLLKIDEWCLEKPDPVDKGFISYWTYGESLTQTYIKEVGGEWDITKLHYMSEKLVVFSQYYTHSNHHYVVRITPSESRYIFKS